MLRWLGIGLLLGTSAAMAQGTVVGSGGDPLRVILERAQAHGAQLARRMTAVQVDAVESPEIAAWLREHRAQLASDVAAAQHELVDELPAFCPAVSTCACTTREPSARVYFKVAACVDLDVDVAAEMLLHESVHHFGVEDEDFADGVAHAVSAAFRASGLPQWQTTAVAGAPARRYDHTAVLAGERVVVFGGCDAEGKAVGDGGVFDPRNDTWEALPLDGAPAARCGHAAVWTGREMLVWGGVGRDGVEPRGAGAYSFETGTWRSLRAANAPAPFAHVGHAWSGREWLLCGMSADGLRRAAVVYRPATDSWWSVGDAATCARTGHVVVWIDAPEGGRFVIWGGVDAEGRAVEDGWLYDPRTNRGEALPRDGSPGARTGAAVAVEGSQMMLWGGQAVAGAPLGDGFAFDLATRTWQELAMDGAPTARFDAAAASGGGRLFVFGGARNTPGHDRLLAMLATGDASWYGLTTTNAPSGRIGHSALWTGDAFFVWGGRTVPDAAGEGLIFGDGGLFRP